MRATDASPGGTSEAAERLRRCSAVLTHHWLVRRRGGERVLEALAELLPGAPVYTLVHRLRPGQPPARLDGHAVLASPLSWLPGAGRWYPALLPLMPLAARLMCLPPVDLVVCSDAAIAKAMRVDRRSRLVCYCHSPMRYVWEPHIAEQYAQTLPALLRPTWRAVCARVRRADYDAAQRVDCFVANSRTVARRIERFYGRPSEVVHPPVDIPPPPPANRRENFYLCVGRHVAYKRLDLAVEACEQLGCRLVVIGDGPDAVRLARGRKSGAVTFLGYQSDEVIRQHYARARALLFPGEEDFGIVPVEALAHGCPAIAYGVGGAAETVADGRTGVLFDAQTVAGLATAITRFEGLTFDAAVLHEHARGFSRERFQYEMAAILSRVLSQ